MKHIPFVFHLILAVIVGLTFFVGLWAVAESTVSNQRTILAKQKIALSEAADVGFQQSTADYEWYERIALYTCPLH